MIFGHRLFSALSFLLLLSRFHPFGTVLFGRGGGTNNHKGNILYLLQKLKLQVPYTLIATQKGKTALSQQLVDYVHAQGGRFVAREDTDRWFEVDDATARRKASQTLREDKTPRDQESKRKTLWRKWADLEHQQKQQQQNLQVPQQPPHTNTEDTETDNSNKSTDSLVEALPAASAATDCNNDDSFATQALEAASSGSLETLRRLSWCASQNRRKIRRVFGEDTAPYNIRCVVDPVSEGTCLHAAALGGHVAMVHWLVTQAGCDMETVDGLGRTARQVAVAQGHTAVNELLGRLAQSS